MDQKISFEAGFNAGVDAENAISPFALSSYNDDYRVGYVVGLAHMESVRCASSYAGAVAAAQQGRKYFIPYEILAPHFDDPSDPVVLEYLRWGYEMDDDEAADDAEPA